MLRLIDVMLDVAFGGANDFHTVVPAVVPRNLFSPV
jgi:hypothetical protein